MIFACGRLHLRLSLVALSRTSEDRGVSRIKSWSGPSAIDEYLAVETKGRLLQSLKSYVASPDLNITELFGRRVTIEDLIARILRDLRENAEAQFGTRIQTAVVGRPVRFVGADTEGDNSFAEGRLTAANRVLAPPGFGPEMSSPQWRLGWP